MTERLHYWAGGKAVGDLVYHAKPAPDICDVGWRGEGQDGLNEAVRGSDSCGRYFEAHKVNFHFCKLEFGWVDDDAVLSTSIQELAGAKELLLNSVIIEEGVVHTSSAPLKVFK